MVTYTWLVTFGLYSLSYGQTVEVQYDSECYTATETMTVTATYSPSGAETVDFIKWYYSGQVATDLIIDASDCTVFGSVPAGYPDSSRLSFDCPSINTNLNANTFKLSVTGLTEDELDDYWGATFTLSAGVDPAVEQKAISICTRPTTTTSTTSSTPSNNNTVFTDTPPTTSISTTTMQKNKTDNTDIIIGVSVGGGMVVLIIICIIVCLYLRHKNRNKKKKDNSEIIESENNSGHRNESLVTDKL